MVLGLSASGCVIDIGHDHDDGILTVEWSLDDTFDPEACLDYEARDIELIIYDWDDYVVVDDLVRCADFEASYDLPEGEYALDATLVDRSGRSVTTTVALDRIDVYEGEETPLPLDFPVDSIR